MMADANKLNRWTTWREIQSQPDIWRHWARKFDVGAVRNWLDQQAANEIWFCGAGSSAYIGDIVVAALEHKRRIPMRSVPSTDLVSRPKAYLTDRNPLIVSFGRSGNSSESLGTLDALDQIAPNAPRLNVTCNPDGALAIQKSPGPQFVVLLPETTHDAGFAMTASFSTMLLSAMRVFDSNSGDTDLIDLAEALAGLLPKYRVFAEKTRRPGRIVFLGTGAMTFAAREAALKVMELTAGQIPAVWDSTLGFRHGPKSFVDDRTDVVVFTSSDSHAALYEADLIAELRSQFPSSAITSIGVGGDIPLPLRHSDGWTAPLVVAFAQILGVVWSDHLGLNVDDPFAGTGTLSRVVSGVTLHEVKP